MGIVESLNYSVLTRWLYNKITKSKKFLRKAEIIYFLKSGRKTSIFANFDRQKNSLVLNEKHPDIPKNIEVRVASTPIIDDATNRYVFYVKEGENKTFNPITGKTNDPTSDEDLAFSWYDLGLKEGRSEILKIALSKQVMLLVIVIFIVLFLSLGLTFIANSNISELVKKMDDMQVILKAIGG